MDLLIYDFIIKTSPKTKFSDAQIFLQEFAGRKFSRPEAEIIWSKILDHKWNMSERLRRDVGLRVATLDYIEHFYQPNIAGRKNSVLAKILHKVLNIVKTMFRDYAEAKGKYMPYI